LETSGALGALGTLETSGALGAGKNFIRLFFAEYEGRKIATALVSSFARKATYLHGASDNEYRQLMAPQLLQWEIIKTMKAEGANLYDFYGIDEQKWPGVTRFKQGFGGEERVYNGVYDLILRPVRYGFYRLLKSLRRLIKG
jgi:lipid II:glycine glycyltransferase (peptidoglycan interpeptide bridge formation enzyme)